MRNNSDFYSNYPYKNRSGDGNRSRGSLFDSPSYSQTSSLNQNNAYDSMSQSKEEARCPGPYQCMLENMPCLLGYPCDKAPSCFQLQNHLNSARMQKENHSTQNSPYDSSLKNPELSESFYKPEFSSNYSSEGNQRRNYNSFPDYKKGQPAPDRFENFSHEPSRKQENTENPYRNSSDYSQNSYNDSFISKGINQESKREMYPRDSINRQEGWQESRNYQQDYENSAPKKKKSWGTIFMIILIVILLILNVILYLLRKGIISI